MLERLYNALKGADLDVRLATLHTGVCTAPYCVLYEGQPVYGRSVVTRHVLVDVLVPNARPELLPETQDKIATAMLPTGCRLTTVSPTIALEDYKAVSATMDFIALCGL